jgi:hypothetical protein
MKIQKNLFKFFLQTVLVLSTIGFFSIAQAAVVINIEVNDDETALDITTHGTCNDSSNSRGCIKASGRQQINFNLVGDKMCSLETGEKWRLDSVVLSESKDAGPGISRVASDDFGADANTGRITDKLLHNDQHITVRNNNTAVYDVWYTVYATCGGQTIDADPRIKNDGSGNN